MKNLIFILALLLFFTSCKQDEYYVDGGTSKAEFNGDMLQYLESKPVLFDSVAQIIKLAGLEQTFKNESFTFFAPSDEFIKVAIGTYINQKGDTVYNGGVNSQLRAINREPIKKLSDVDPLIWKKFIQRYMFKGTKRMIDYPQIDFDQRLIFPGQKYVARDGSVFNIGVTYADANGIKYIGYRQLNISFIPDLTDPEDNWVTYAISSADIKPNNGIVHALQGVRREFGYNNDFIRDVIDSRN
jgi:hypothetical protein